MLDFDLLTFQIIVGALAVIWLLCQEWFWTGVAWLVGLVFLLCALASGFAMIASVIYFQILAAIGFFFLTGILTIFGINLMDAA